MCVYLDGGRGAGLRSESLTQWFRGNYRGNGKGRYYWTTAIVLLLASPSTIVAPVITGAVNWRIAPAWVDVDPATTCSGSSSSANEILETEKVAIFMTR